MRPRQPRIPADRQRQLKIATAGPTSWHRAPTRLGSRKARRGQPKKASSGPGRQERDGQEGKYLRCSPELNSILGAPTSPPLARSIGWVPRGCSPVHRRAIRESVQTPGLSRLLHRPSRRIGDPRASEGNPNTRLSLHRRPGHRPAIQRNRSQCRSRRLGADERGPGPVGRRLWDEALRPIDLSAARVAGGGSTGSEPIPPVRIRQRLDERRHGCELGDPGRDGRVGQAGPVEPDCRPLVDPPPASVRPSR